MMQTTKTTLASSSRASAIARPQQHRSSKPLPRRSSIAVRSTDTDSAVSGELWLLASAISLRREFSLRAHRGHQALRTCTEIFDRESPQRGEKAHCFFQFVDRPNFD